MPKRKPIDYTQQYTSGIFRPRDEVEAELASLDRGALPTPPASGPVTSNDASFERTNERTRTRHSFDVFKDQIAALSEIQVRLFRQTGAKPKLGELVQQALDDYIDRMNDRSNERTDLE